MTKPAAPTKLLDREPAPSTSAESTAAQAAPLGATLKRKRAEDEAQTGESQAAAVEQAVETTTSVSAEPTTEVAQKTSSNAVAAEADAGAKSESAEADRVAALPWAKVAMGGLGLVGAVAAAAGGGSKSSASPQVPTGQEPRPTGQSPKGDGGETPAKPAPDAPKLETPGSNGTINAEGGVKIGGLNPGQDWAYSLDGGKTWHPGNGEGVPADALAEGKNELIVVAIDKDGKRSEPATIEITKDTQVAAPSVESSNGANPINATGSIAVDGIEIGATWDCSLDGGKTWTLGAALSIPASALTEGTNHLTVRQTDAAGNIATTQCTVILDSSVNKPSLTMDDASSGVAKLGQNVVVGGIEAGATWAWRVHTEAGYGEWIQGAGGRISTNLLPQNTPFAVWVRQTDLAGNQASSYLLGMVDTQAPAAAVLQLASDTGASQSDGITADAKINVSGLEYGARWDYSLDNGTTWTVGVGAALSADALREGLNHVLVRQTDAAGNSSSASISVTKDTQVTGPTVSASNGVDPINASGTVAVSGLEAGAKWDYSLDNGTTWMLGAGSSIAASDLSEGANHITIRQTDVAGNQARLTVDVVKDSVVEQPTVGLTDSRNLKIRNLEKGASWDFSVDGGQHWKSGVGDSLPTTELAGSNGQVLIRQTDLAGNQAASALNVAYGVDGADVIMAPTGGAVMIGGKGPDAFVFNSQSRGTYVLADYDLEASLPAQTVKDIERVDFLGVTQPSNLFDGTQAWIQMRTEDGHTVARFDFDNKGDFSNPELIILLPNPDQQIWITFSGRGYFTPSPLSLG